MIGSDLFRIDKKYFSLSFLDHSLGLHFFVFAELNNLSKVLKEEKHREQGGERKSDKVVTSVGGAGRHHDGGGLVDHHGGLLVLVVLRLRQTGRLEEFLLQKNSLMHKDDL